MRPRSPTETKKANAPPALFFVFAARVTPLSLFPLPEGRWSAGRRQGLARPHQRTWRGSVPRAVQGRFARPALGRAPPSAKGAAPPGAPPQTSLRSLRTLESGRRRNVVEIGISSVGRKSRARNGVLGPLTF